jgi:hypothetical protein
MEFVTDEQEYAIRSQLKWKRDGADWVLWYRRRCMGRVVPDAEWKGMFRSLKHGGLSDMANLSHTKDSVMATALRELAWEVRKKAA